MVSDDFSCLSQHTGTVIEMYTMLRSQDRTTLGKAMQIYGSSFAKLAEATHLTPAVEVID